MSYCDWWHSEDAAAVAIVVVGDADGIDVGIDCHGNWRVGLQCLDVSSGVPCSAGDELA